MAIQFPVINSFVAGESVRLCLFGKMADLHCGKAAHRPWNATGAFTQMRSRDK